MMKILQEAVEKVKRLPEARQVDAAEILEQIAAAGDDVFVVPGEHREAVLEGLAEAERGDYATDEQVDATLKRPWRA